MIPRENTWYGGEVHTNTSGYYWFALPSISAQILAEWIVEHRNDPTIGLTQFNSLPVYMGTRFIGLSIASYIHVLAFVDLITREGWVWGGLAPQNIREYMEQE